MKENLRMNSSGLTLLSLGLMLVTSTACSKNTNPVSSASQAMANSAPAGYTCSFTEVDEFPLSVDPTQDFAITNSLETSMIFNSTCAGVSSGAKFNVGTESLSRSGNQISINAGTDGILLGGTQATVPQRDLQLCSNGIQETGSLQSVELDSVANQILVTTSWTLVNNGCTQSQAVAGQSAPGALITSSFVVPASVASGTTYVYLADDPGVYYWQKPIQEWVFTGSNSVISSIVNNGETAFTMAQAGAPSSWSIGFWPPTGSSLVPGNYPNIVWYSGVSATNAGFLFNGPVGQRDPQSGSSFQILSSAYDLSGNVLSFVANFTIVNNASTGEVTRGVIHYNAP